MFLFFSDGNCLQSIEHPGCVWATKFLDNGDIVTGCSDGIVRIWTSCSDRVADDVEINAYESLISERTLSRYPLCFDFLISGASISLILSTIS